MRRLVCLALLVAAASPASAAVVAFDFTGEVDYVNAPFASIVEVGSPLSGRLTYDTSAVDEDPGPTRGSYPGATLEFTMGTYSYAGEGRILVYDDPAFDQFQFMGETAGADPIDGVPLGQVNLEVVAGPELYASDALPAVPPALDDPAITEPWSARIGIDPPESGFTYQRAPLLTLPEPGGAAAGLATGAVLAALARRRNRLRGGGPGSGAAQERLLPGLV